MSDVWIEARAASRLPLPSPPHNFRRTMAPDASQPPRRIVSLLGASTETIYRLGLGHLLVGRSHECDWPPQVLNLPCVSAPRLDVDASSSATIDAIVREHAAEGQPMYKLDDDVISELRPDLIIAQDHCRVCAITPADLARADAKAQGSATCSNIKQLVVRPATLGDCMENITTIADALRVPERGLALRQTLEGRLDRVRAVVSDVHPRDTPTPRVALLEWCQPIMGCGYWLPELVEIAGGYPLHCPPGGSGGATPSISYESLLESSPDVVIFALCGFGLTRAASELLDSWGGERLKDLQERVSVYVVDGNYLVNRSGPRLVESAEAIAEAIHKDVRGHFGHFGTDFLCSLDDAIDMARRGLHTGSTKIRPPPAINNGSVEEKNVANPDQQQTNLPVQAPLEVVKEQLRLLRTGDIAHAFVLNSTANQARWCGSERFEAVLRGHDDFQRLLSEKAEIGESEERDGIATVPVTLPAGEKSKKVDLIWTMTIDKSADGKTSAWRTEKVGFGN